MRKRFTAAVFLSLAAAFGAGHAVAHESWIEPSTFEIRPGRPIGVRICVADGFEGWSLAREPRRIARFAAVNDAGEIPVVGLEGSDPAGALRLTQPGSYVIAYQSERAFLQVPADQFEAFLREKELEQVIRQRAQRRPQTAVTREAYSRYLKALVRVGDAADAQADRRLGMALELIVDSGLVEPASTARGFRLLYRGAPLAGAQVVATRLGTADRELRARTDADGRVQFPLRDAGKWRIAAVHMIEAPRSIRAEWESFWTSLTLEVPTMARNTPPRGANAGTACANRFVPLAPGART